MFSLVQLLAQHHIPTLPPLPPTSASSSSNDSSAFNALFAKPSLPPPTSTQPPSIHTFIEAVEFFDNVLIVGTSDGQLLGYAIARDPQTGDFECTLTQKKMLATGRKRIDQLMAIVAESKLLVLSESTLTFHSLKSLSPISSNAAHQNFKGITAACCDRVLDPPFNFCIAKRRSLHFYFISENQLGTTKEIPLPDGATLLQKHGPYLLAADAHTYKLVHETSGVVTPLFPYDRSVMKPIVCAVGGSGGSGGGGEFLLAFATTQGVGLGMFVNEVGDAVRGTLQWSSVPKSIVFQFPYILALLHNATLEIHNLQTLLPIQTVSIPNNEPRFLIDTQFAQDALGGLKILLVCRDAVVGVCMKPMEVQIREVLERGEVKEAVELMEGVVGSGEMRGVKKQILDDIYKDAGIAYFQSLSFTSAVQCFEKGEVDPLVVLKLFGGVVGAGNAGTEMVQWEGDIEALLAEGVRRRNPDAREGSEEWETGMRKAISEAKGAVSKYFVDSRNEDFAEHCLEEMDDFLLVVYQLTGSEELNAFLSVPNYCNVLKAEQFLRQQEQYYALSLLFKSTSQTRKVLDILIRFVSGEYKDDDFEGPDSVVAYLSEVTDRDVVLEYTQKLLAMDPVLGVEVLMTTPLEMDQSETLELLEQYGTPAITAYLENLRDVKGVYDPACDERLLGLYVEEVERLYDAEALQAIRDEYLRLDSTSTPRPSFPSFLHTHTDPLSLARTKLTTLLHDHTTSHVPSSTRASLLARLLTPARVGLVVEQAYAYAMQEDGFAREVGVWVGQLMDFVSAEKACGERVRGGGCGDAYRVLLKVYLEGGDHPFHAHEYSNQVLHLLNTYPDEFELSEILEVLPDRWSLAALNSYFSSQLRSELYQARERLLFKSLVKSENFQANSHLVDCYNSFEPFVLAKGRTCVLCSRALVDAGQFVRLPVGGKVELAHVECVQGE
ncbi:transforming growth factor, beta receptor associated protein 1 [Podochytrium sp. JEL0797]|nr:transforming growth factor, beta receptor associated protein 1 [Podochytrium sp. JEL0797]